MGVLEVSEGASVLGWETRVWLDGSPGLWLLSHETFPSVGQRFRRHLTTLAWISAMKRNGPEQIKEMNQGALRGKKKINVQKVKVDFVKKERPSINRDA